VSSYSVIVFVCVIVLGYLCMCSVHVYDRVGVRIVRHMYCFDLRLWRWILFMFNKYSEHISDH